MLLGVEGLVGIARQLINLGLELIDIRGVSQVVGQLDGVIIALVGYSLADECIIIIGGAEVFT